MTAAQILLAYDNFMHYMVLTHPFGGGGKSKSPPASPRPYDGARIVDFDAITAKMPDRVVRAEQPLSTANPVLQHMIQGL